MANENTRVILGKEYSIDYVIERGIKEIERVVLSAQKSKAKNDLFKQLEHKALATGKSLQDVIAEL